MGMQSKIVFLSMAGSTHQPRAAQHYQLVGRVELQWTCGLRRQVLIRGLDKPMCAQKLIKTKNKVQ